MKLPSPLVVAVAAMVIGGCATHDRPVVYGLVQESESRTDEERHQLQREILVAALPDGRAGELPGPRPQYQRFLHELEAIETLIEAEAFTEAHERLTALRLQVLVDRDAEENLLRKLEPVARSTP